jgi:hypothetical protein
LLSTVTPRGRKVLVVIPLNPDGYLLSGKAKPVQSRLVADFAGWKQDAQVENVISALRADDDGREKPPNRRS